MIWVKSKSREYAPWCRHRIEAAEWLPAEFRRYNVRIRTQIFEEYSEEFQQVYDRERTWQRLKA